MIEGLTEFGPGEKAYHYAVLGPTVQIAASTTVASTATALVPGARYLLHVSPGDLGTNTLWVLQEAQGADDATTAVPSTPIYEDGPIAFEFLAYENLDGISVITDAGTVTCYITQIGLAR